MPRPSRASRASRASGASSAPRASRATTRVTAAQVAAHAGLSVATVSLVLNGKTDGRVSPANIERVRASVAELGYVVDQGASALARGRSDLVVLVAPDLSNPFFGSVIQGIEQELGPRFQLVLSVTESGVQPSASDVRRFAGLRPAGYLVDAPSDAFLDELGDDAPLVVLDAPELRTDVAAVNYDMRDAIDALAAHLASRGHRTLGYLDSITDTRTFQLRREQLTAAAERNGMTVSAPDAARSIIELGAAAAAFGAAWPEWRADGVTAVVCATDTHAYGVLEAARASGLSVPGDVAVTGFDDLPYSRVTAPPLTTVRLPGEPLGRAAARSLVAQIDGADAAGGPPPDLVATLIARGSTA
ncbi:LacI family DNA-binding transcriptional regulator [Leifsonia sp. NCR5]|uniref:LacI family DNA-binding transcriptional regulator n=1 Tax=Leifsonia sp. NCR5 TaxID=1978342 RepID=UPI000A18A5B9|nr:LacI family DNA-binding transcriptional regulator [Leifsonia sp. NCR5]